MKIVLLIAAFIASTFFIAQPVAAHVLITDETYSMGAVLHIIPDDDPVAGEMSTLYFDMQTKSPVTVTLEIKHDDGTIESPEVNVDGALATTEYTFPSQGVYELTYRVQTSTEEYVFHQTQRITRGVASGNLDRTDYAWAEVLIVVSIVGVLILIILAVNNRREITKRSTF